jgi:hypothetical protein
MKGRANWCGLFVCSYRPENVNKTLVKMPGGCQMALRYDFDMASMTLDGLPDQFGDLALTGVGAERRAMFRDPQVVAALGRADPAVQTFLLESGFALQVYDSGAPPGRYPISDENPRVKVIEKLTANLETHDLTGANWGGFDFQEFLETLDKAMPLEDETLLAPPLLQASRPTPNRPKSSGPQLRRRVAFAGLAVGFILILYAALEIIR